MRHETSNSRSLIRLVWPTVATYFSFAALEMSDAWMAGRLGSEGLAAMLSGQQIIFLLFALGFGLFTGVNVCVAQAAETHGGAAAGIYAWQGIWIALGAGALVSPLHWGASPLFRLIGHDLGVREQEIAYLRIAIWSMPFQCVALTLSNFFLGIDRPAVPLKSGLVQVLVNAPLSWVLMFGIPGRFPGIGLEGAAWGSLVASILGCAVLLADYLGKDLDRAFATRKMTWNPGAIRNVLRLGLPRSILSVSDVLFWNVALVLYVGNFGTQHIAASAVMYSVLMLMLVPADGVNMALSTVSAHYLASSQPDMAVSKLRRGLLMNILVMLAFGVIFAIHRESILGFFSDDPEVIRIGSGLFLMLPWILLADAFISALEGWLAGAGDVQWPTRLALISSLSIVIAGGWAIQLFLPALASFGIWIAITLNRTVIAATLIGRWGSGLWRNFEPSV